jgi:L-ribulokinase
MAVVCGVDFGTLSVRVTLVDSERKTLGSAISEYPLHRRREDPELATQSHNDHMRALAEAMREAIQAAGIQGHAVAAIALDTTGSSVVPVGPGMVPLDEYYLWCDHRAKSRQLRGVEARILRSGDLQSCFTGCATTLKNAANWPARSNIAIWWRPHSAGSRNRAK